MAQRSLMYYAYFRFYIDSDDIESGLDQFCTEWEHMYAIGYNYQEYKCFVDNLGGFEHWVGDMRGYISQTREIGFMDGSPSDAIYDTTLLMGAQKITWDNVEILNGSPVNKSIYFRKITAQDAGIANRFKLSSGQTTITHPVMYTLDLSQVEILKPESEIVDKSTVDSYEFTADLTLAALNGIEESFTGGGTLTDFGNMIDLDYETYGRITSLSNVTSYLTFDMQHTFTAMAIDIKNYYNVDSRWTNTLIHTSPDLSTWTLIGSTGHSTVRKVFYNNNVSGRYVRVTCDPHAATVGRTDIFGLLCS